MDKLRSEWLRRSEELKKHKEEFFQSTICGIFHKTALEYPDKTAVADDKDALTYRELDEYSNFLAAHLIRQGVRQEEIVAVRSGRHVKTLVGILGIWKAGAAYLFLDDCYPEARNQRLKEECGYRIVLTDEYFSDLKLHRQETYVDRSLREGLAILVYTSGSTSMPKGVMLEHRNITASVSNFHRLGFHGADRVCIFASFSFVASVYDICSSLVTGASMEIIPEGMRRSIEQIVRFLKEKQITVTFLPPHMAMKFMNYDDSAFSLRALLVGSEPVRNLEPKSYRIINVYAASETCSLAAVYEITSREKTYPIGTLNPTLKGYIVGEDGRLAGPGEEGELWLAGPQISRGYYKRAQLTQEQFIKNPFSQEKGYEHLFKTKDMVCQTEDGNLRYISRKDNMFKVRGFRVESGAVESAVLKCSSIKEVAVTAFTDAGGCNILCGYFTSDEKVDVKQLKEKLKAVIPYYMVPTALMQVEQLPRNMNNKIDRKKLMPPKELNDHKLLAELY